MEGCVGREEVVDEGTEMTQEWDVCGPGKAASPGSNLVSWVEVQYAEPLRARLGAPGSHHVFSHATFVS